MSDIMKYGGRSAQSGRRLPQTNLLLDRKSIPTSAMSFGCEWVGYDLLIVCAMQYSNVMASIVVPTDYFAETNSSRGVYISDTVYGKRFFVYKNGDGAVYANTNSSDANCGIRIYGILLGE